MAEAGRRRCSTATAGGDRIGGTQGEFREAVLARVRERYTDFGPTLASEHLASDDGRAVHAESLRRGCGKRDYGEDNASANRIASGASGSRSLGSWYSCTGAFMVGWKSAAVRLVSCTW